MQKIANLLKVGEKYYNIYAYFKYLNSKKIENIISTSILSNVSRYHQKPLEIYNFHLLIKSCLLLSFGCHQHFFIISVNPRNCNKIHKQNHT